MFAVSRKSIDNKFILVSFDLFLKQKSVQLSQIIDEISSHFLKFNNKNERLEGENSMINRYGK